MFSNSCLSLFPNSAKLHNLVSDIKGGSVFENRMLRRIFGPKKDDVIGRWRKLHNEVIHNLYSTPGIIRMMRLAGHIGVWWESQKERDPDVIGRIILKWILVRQDGLIWLRMGTSGGHM
jgi:hypothetical protein